MKTKLIFAGLACIGLLGAGCHKDSCKDADADNYDANAKNSNNCMYRYSSSVMVSGVPATKPTGESWDPEGNMPDLKMIFFKNESGHVDQITNVVVDASSATLTPPETRFTNGDWQYELRDDDIGAAELIATGHFNPLKDGSGGSIKITNGTISITFNYTVK